MYLNKYIIFYTSICLSLFGSLVNAETNVDSETPINSEIVIAITPQWLEEQAAIISKAQAQLKQDQKAWQSQEKQLQKKIDRFEKTEQPVTDEMLKAAATERNVASDEVETLRLERQKTRTHLEKLEEQLKEQQEILEDLSNTPESPEEPTTSTSTSVDTTESSDTSSPSEPKTSQPSEPTASTSVESPPSDESTEAAEAAAAQAQQISELENNITLLTEGIKLDKQYLDLLNRQYELANKRLISAIQWHDKLQTQRQMLQIQEKEQAMNEARAAVEQDQEALQFQQEDLPNKIARLDTTQIALEVLEDILEKAALDKETSAIEVDNFKLEIQSLEANLERQRNRLQEREEELEQLRKTPLSDPSETEVQNQTILELENQIKRQNQTLELERQNIDILNQRLEQTNTRLQLESGWHDKLRELHEKRQQQYLEIQIQQDQQRYLSRALELRQQLEELPDSAPTAQRHLLKTQIQEANEHAQQVMRLLQLNHIEKQIQQWEASSQQEGTEIYQQLENLKNLIEKINNLFLEINGLQELLQGKLELLEQQLEVAKKTGETLSGPSSTYNKQSQQLLEQLKNTLQKESDKLPKLREQAQELQAQVEKRYKETIHLSLFRLRKLPVNVTEWQILLEQLTPLPGLFIQQVQLTWQGFLQAFEHTNRQRWFITSIIAFIWLGSLILLLAWSKHILTRLTSTPKPSFMVHSFWVGLRLLQMNVMNVAVAGILLLIIWLTQPTSSSATFVLILVFGWLGVKWLTNLFWLLLNENLEGQNRLKTYLQLQGMLLVMGLLTIMTALVHVEQEGYVLKVPLMARDLIDTLFMLFLSLTVWPLLRLRKMMLNTETSGIQGYWRLVMNFITWLVPLFILLVSILGLIGYLNLGWSIAKHLSLSVLALTGWLLARGLVADVINLWVNFASRHGNYASLWTESLIPLVHKLLEVTLLAVAIIGFLWINGWSDVATQKLIAEFLSYPLFTMGNSSITISNILLSLFILWIVFWFGSWSRQITYQWVYQNVSDSGVRHSLSVFTQYAVILIGLLIALNVIGINLTTLTVFAGAIGVGIGFGLQSIVNNFLSGIILLVERPVRAGDLVDVASYHGIVKQIGIRSLTIQTLDRQEAIVPNSEFVSNTFVNYTLSDRLRRITLNIHVSYDDDLYLAQNILKEILEEKSEVLQTPPYAIYLWEFTDFSVHFFVFYFVDMREVNFVKVKSEILFQIWERFKVAGIRMPYPQQDVHLKSVPNQSQSQLEPLLTGG